MSPRHTHHPTPLSLPPYLLTPPPSPLTPPVVPKGAQAKLTMHNAPEFLEQSRYVPALEARQAKGIRKDKMLVVRRTVNRCVTCGRQACVSIRKDKMLLMHNPTAHMHHASCEFITSPDAISSHPSPLIFAGRSPFSITWWRTSPPTPTRPRAWRRVLCRAHGGSSRAGPSRGSIAGTWWTASST